MKLAVIHRPQAPTSLRIYRDNLVHQLEQLGARIALFKEPGPIPLGCDVLWDPGLGMRRVPSFLGRSPLPVVVTVHGLRAFSLPISELEANWLRRCRLALAKQLMSHDWRSFKHHVSAVITVSAYGARELSAAFAVPSEKIRVVHHGLDHQIFRPGASRQATTSPYLLLVSAKYHAVKNIDRVFEAYRRLPAEGRPRLVAIIPGYQGGASDIAGLELIRERLPHAEIADWYRGALGFVFLSIRESFGMPILEAMACGCPVITANATGCAEVAGEAALQVDPRSIEEIARAMHALVEDEQLRERLRQHGLARAAQFTWRRSAERHLAVFQEVVEGARGGLAGA